LYQNGYISGLATPGGLVTFMRAQLGRPIPSPVVLGRVSEKFREAVKAQAERQQIIKSKRTISRTNSSGSEEYGMRSSSSAWRGWRCRWASLECRSRSSHTTLNVMSLMGVLMLVGIAASNSILKVEFAHRVERQDRPVDEAIISSCRVRPRPILMTSRPTIIGLAPIALKPGSQQYARSMLG
jgi:hypothetical protein